MTDALPLDRLVAVSARFTRSVSLVRDAERADALNGYILTPTGRGVLRRLAEAVRGDSPTRAWSLTGPYGSGKSAFALFCAQMLGGDQRIRLQARAFLEEEDPALSDLFFGQGAKLAKRAGKLCPVLVTGSRQPLEAALAGSLAASLRRTASRGRPPQVVERLERLAAQPEPTAKVVTLFEEANEYLERFGSEAAGILLIVDELGKFLEYGASNPDRGDVFVLQELAEAATRSQRPFLVLTILHQALDRYADHLSPSRRAEWAKVQGRFEDVAFEEKAEEVLRLLTHAIRHEGTEAELRTLQKRARASAKEALALGLRSGSLGGKELQQCLESCYPLHPLTSLVLGPLFRQLAQNERSLFAFLASTEPFGFQDFLRREPRSGDQYRLHDLFDYVIASLGPSLFATHRGKAWAEVQSGLERLHDASDAEVRLAKTIGILQAVGASCGIPASRVTLQSALKGTGSPDEMDAAIDSLVRRSLVIFRRHLGSYALWEGSDLDIDARLQDARRSVEREQSIASFLTRQVPPQPMIARRHYFQKGTLRYFETCYSDTSTLRDDLLRDLSDADGRVVLCLPRNAEEREAMRVMIQLSASNLPVVVVLPQDIFDVQELCHDLLCLRWVLQQTPELETDRTARKEVHARLAIAEQNLRAHLAWVFSAANVDRCTWFDRGAVVTLSSQRALNDLLSRVCDQVYHSTPTWRNELVNRRSLSSAAAAARRDLIEAMFEHPHVEALAIAGTPPQRSMYETLLRASRLHRKQGGMYGFFAPDAKAEPAVRELWDALERFLTETESGRLSVERLFALLRKPPFGLKDGVLPVLLAVVLVHFHSQVALYEEGTFVPRPNAAVFERVFRSPEKFDLQRFKIAGPRAEVFQRYAEMLTSAGAMQGDDPDLLTVVRPLVRFIKDLPDYVGKTRQISVTARTVLRTIQEARQPDRLLFLELPTACGIAPFDAKGRIAQDEVDSYFVTLRSALTELQRAYPQLLADIERLIVKAFNREGPLADTRREVEHQAKLVLNLAVDARLKSFLLRAAEAGSDDTTWLESIATLLAGKPPTVWDDQDRARFEVQLAATARSFEHFKVLAYEMQRSGFALLDGDHRMLRVSITVPDGDELERVVHVPPHLSTQAERAREQVRKVLEEQKLLENREASVALLAQLARQLLSEGDPKGDRP